MFLESGKQTISKYKDWPELRILKSVLCSSKTARTVANKIPKFSASAKEIAKYKVREIAKYNKTIRNLIHLVLD